ncbi:5-oxoprolinase subunit PxpB [Lentibacillus salicampi]|nr:5-oxoprolinase subunit PxpB [Lentibacillus salicampi]
MSFSIQAVGDSAVKIQFLGNVTPDLNKEIQFFSRKLHRTQIPGVVEWVPAYDSVTVYYQPHQISYRELCTQIDHVWQLEIEPDGIEPRCLTIPVIYGGGYGPDLERVAAVNGFSTKEVVSQHIQGEYLVYMLGFLPGFPYLGGLDERIATPRLEVPRRETPAGAVGIASKQTGIYPITSPGGWNIIGKTPVQLFDIGAEEAFLFRPGDKVQFYEIEEKEYKDIRECISEGSFEIGRLIQDDKAD